MTTAYREWKYREIPITIANPSSTEGVQEWINIYFYDGMDENGADIRFSDILGVTLPYWIETKTSTYFKVWVKLPASATTIYFYYGNPSATSESSGTNTFDFFDDFEGTSLDSSKWTRRGTYGSTVISGGIAQISGPAADNNWEIQSTGAKVAFNTGIYEFSAKVAVDADNSARRWMVGTEDSASTSATLFIVTSAGARAYYTSVPGTTQTTGRTSAITSYTQLKIINNGTSTRFYEDNVLKATHSTTVPATPQGLVLGSRSDDVPLSVQWCRVRKYVATEPTLSMLYQEWVYRQIRINVTNPSATDGIQTEMKILLRTGMETDGKDIRFSSATYTPLSYWIESMTDGIFTIWIKLPANDSVIYFYHGNSSATAVSSGDATFELFELWDAASVDTTKWNTSTYGDGAFAQSGGNIWLAADAGYASISSKATFNYPIKIRHVTTVASVIGGSRHRFTVPVSFDAGMFEGKMYWGGASAIDYELNRVYNLYQYYYPGIHFELDLYTYPENTSIFVASTGSGVSPNAVRVSFSVGDPNSTASSGRMSISQTTVSKYAYPAPSLSFDFSDWSNSWNKINVISPSTLNWVQSKLKLSLLSGMNTTGADLRFTDVYGNSLSYWIEEIEKNIFTIWIKLPAYDQIIYLHYGNSSATAISSGVNTFDFFDDFESLSTDVWTASGTYSISDSILSIGGAVSSSVQSIQTFGYYTICDFKLSHPAGNSCVNGYYNLSDNKCATWVGGAGINYDRVQTQIAPNQFTTQDDFTKRLSSDLSIYSIIYKQTEVEFYCDYTHRRTLTTTIPTAPIKLLIYSPAGAGNVTADWIRIRKYVPNCPQLLIIYDLEALDPISFEITSHINSAYTQLTARFATNLVPHERERIVCYADGTDVQNKIMFFGRILSNTPTLSSFENELQMVAADDMVALTQQNVLWYFLGYRTDDVGDVLNSVTYDNDLWVGSVSSRTLPNVVFNFDPTYSKYDVLKKVLDYFGFLFTPRYSYSAYYNSMLIEVINACLPLDIDTASGFGIPAPLEFSWPSQYIVDKPTVGDTVDNCNRVTVYGNITSTGLQTVSTAVTDEIVSCSGIDDATIGLIYANIAKDDRIKDDRIEEKGSTAEIEAIKWLLYNNTKRATVKFKLVGMIGIELYQRIRFGAGFPSQLTELTNQKQLNYVWAGNPSNHFDYTDFHTVDVSGVPTPSWLRVAGITYNRNGLEKYIEIEAVTDFIYSADDPAVPAPYNSYMNVGMMKPIATDSASIIKSMIDAAIRKS
jgi:hypothetical protein